MNPQAIGLAALRGGSERGARRVGPALESMYRFVLWLVPTVEKFPRRQKFLLGDRLQATALDLLARLVEATYTRPAAVPGRGEPGIEKLRFLCRLAKDLGTSTRGATSTRRACLTRPAGWSAVGGRRMRRRRADDLFDRFATFEALCAGRCVRRRSSGTFRDPPRSWPTSRPRCPGPGARVAERGVVAERLRFLRGARSEAAAHIGRAVSFGASSVVGTALE